MRLLLKQGIFCLLATTLFSFEGETKRYEDVVDQNTLSIRTPSLSNRQTAKIRLENGLSVFLVSDKDARKSAAALCVTHGTWSDPAEYPGMAHFLEHMLFMGTKAFPNENEFMQYVTDHGGRTNAFTAPDRTVYSFTINNDSFEGGLNRFAHFFIDPLFQTSGVQRELLAVDQEHSKNIRTDSRRNWMIFKETGNQNHPNKAFGTGNAKTLGHIPREALISWYQQHYLANRMYLVVYSDMPMKELKEFVAKDFIKVPSHKGAAGPEYGHLSSSMQRGHIVYIKPVKDLKVLTLDFELPKKYSKDLETKSAELIAYTLRNGSENSLIENLKRNHLAESLSCSVSEISLENKFISLSIRLTKEGVKEVDRVIEKCFETINGLKKTGVPKYIFNEMQTMDRIQYEYQGREDSFEFVTDAAYELPQESLSTYPLKSTLATSYSLQDIQTVLDLMSPQNCIFTIVANPELTNVYPDKKEKWNGGEYTIKKVGASYLKNWAALKPSKEIGLPLKNPYIPEKLELIRASSIKEDAPYLISHNEFGKNYVYEDTFYEVPEISYKMGFKSPFVTTSAKSQAEIDLFMKAFSQKLSPLLSVANDAGLYASLSTSDLKLNIQVHGYSEKADEFLKNLLLGIKSLRCTEKEFSLYQDSLLSQYENTKKAQPYIQGAELLSSILYNDAPLPEEKAKALQTLNFEEFNEFIDSLFSVCYIEGLYSGNLTRSTAENLLKMIQKTLGYKGYPLHEHDERQLLLLPKDGGPFMVSEKISALGSAALLVVQEGPFTYDKKASQLVLSKALAESFYDTLRSKQQTGYIAASWAREVEKQLLQFFVVQSATHEAEDLVARFEIFLENFVKDFGEELPEKRMQSIVKSQVDLLKKPLPNLQEMAQHLYTLAFQRDGQFDYNQELAKALEQLSYQVLKLDAKTFFARNNSKRLAVLVEGDMPSDHRFQYHKITTDAIKRVGTYISSN